MHSRKHRRAAWQRRLLLAVLLSILGECLTATQVVRYDALGESLASNLASSTADSATDPFVGVETLSREHLIAGVLRRNPTVESARQAWRGAIALHSQTTAFADPTLTYETAPGTISSEHGYGQVVRLSQRFEWPGKQTLRGAIALAEAAARNADLEQVHLHLASTTSFLFDDYYVVRRALEINREHLALVTRLRQSAEAQYAAGRGSQQDPIQADVELALLERKRLRLVARGQVIVAQLNGLLHRPPMSPLPAAPAILGVAALPSGTASEWLVRARQNRPELRSTSHRIEARRSGVALADRAYLPDFSVSGAYSSMWPQLDHQFMVGLSVNIPIQFDARRGGVDEANAALARAQSIHAKLLDIVSVEVRQTWVLLENAVALAALYRDRILPAARRQIVAAEAGYASGHNSFSDIMTAQRRLRTFEQDYAEALANTWQRRAAFARAVGTSPDLFASGGER